MLLAICTGCPCLNSDNEDGDECNLGYSTGWVRAVVLKDDKLNEETATMSPDCKLLLVVMADHSDIVPDLQVLKPLNDPKFAKPIH